MHIRFGDAADIPAIGRVEQSATGLFAGTHMAWAMDEATETGDLRAAIRAGNLWVAEERSAVVGYLFGEAMDDDFLIEELAVTQSHQRRGIGSDLIDVASADAGRRGFRAITLTTDRTLAWNAPYYQRLGFKIMSGDATRCAMERTL